MQPKSSSSILSFAREARPGRSPRKAKPVNFFGHAVVASAFSTEPDFLLGSMLPDLIAMAGVDGRGLIGGDLASGVSLHHATDAVYHEHPLVKRRMAEGAAALVSSGLSRHQARGLAHVGVELVSDGILAVERAPEVAFRPALRRARDSGVVADGLRDDEDRRRWHRLLDLILDSGLPEAYREPGFVTARLESMTRQRPRFRLGPGQVEFLGLWVESVAARIDPEVEQVLDDVLDRLGRVPTRRAGRGAASESASSLPGATSDPASKRYGRP
ncbi:MAG: hypothetical protein H6807_06280 [Planctomycetes bacterium]|nr:hypothetical protein [Planctomycetota bacterium]